MRHHLPDWLGRHGLRLPEELLDELPEPYARVLSAAVERLKPLANGIVCVALVGSITRCSTAW